MKDTSPRVLIVGAGPAGLSAAAALAGNGVTDFLVVEREAEAGGIPRFCPHPTFGLADAFRPMTGPAWARRLLGRVSGAQILTGTPVTEIDPDLAVELAGRDGPLRLRPERILLATGIRETPRPPRLISGERPTAVLTTGALQRLIASGAGLPFRRPVVAGSELVAFSALLSLLHQGIRPVAMVESGPRIAARRPADLVARGLLGVPVLTGHRLAAIRSHPESPSRMQGVTLATPDGGSRELDCDAVILTGCFIPEASLLARLPHDWIDPASGGPAIDQCWRLPEPAIYAAGNLLRPVETGAWAAAEGRAAGLSLAADLAGRLAPPERRVPVRGADPIRLVTPSAIALPGPAPGPLLMCLRMARPARGCLTLAADGREIWRSASIAALPERRIRLTRSLPDLSDVSALEVGFDEQGA